jgi:cytidylate kinase
MSQSHRVIAIDGPAASGKSSVARELARRLNFIYVNSGAMYRAVTWYVLERGVSPDDSAGIARLVESATISTEFQNNELRIRIDDVDPTESLREDRVNNAVSRVSAVPRVRQILVEKMRDYARQHDLVIEGRDIGSVVFPETPFKFYIDASPEVRSRRRAAQGEQDAITVRDYADSSRATSPLVVAKDAEVIDTSHLTIDGVVDEILARLRRKGLIVDLRS